MSRLFVYSFPSIFLENLLRKLLTQVKTFTLGNYFMVSPRVFCCGIIYKCGNNRAGNQMPMMSVWFPALNTCRSWVKCLPQSYEAYFFERLLTISIRMLLTLSIHLSIFCFSSSFSISSSDTLRFTVLVPETTFAVS